MIEEKDFLIKTTRQGYKNLYFYPGYPSRETVAGEYYYRTKEDEKERKNLSIWIRQPITDMSTNEMRHEQVMIKMDHLKKIIEIFDNQ